MNYLLENYEPYAKKLVSIYNDIDYHRFNQAQTKLNDLLLLNNDDHVIWFLLGKLELKQQKSQQSFYYAIEYFEKAIRINNDSFYHEAMILDIYHYLKYCYEGFLNIVGENLCDKFIIFEQFDHVIHNFILNNFKDYFEAFEQDIAQLRLTRLDVIINIFLYLESNLAKQLEFSKKEFSLLETSFEYIEFISPDLNRTDLDPEIVNKAKGIVLNSLYWIDNFLTQNNFKRKGKQLQARIVELIDTIKKGEQ